MDYERHTCDACGLEMGGASRAELVKQGWKWRSTKGRKDDFVMCDQCELEYERRRELAQAVAA